MTNPIKLLVTGGKGMLGSALFQAANQSPRFDVRAPGRDELDVRDLAAVDEWAPWIAGGWIIHCAARVDVEGCAREPEAARETIVEGTRNVARLAAASNARLLYPQSFLVYDGRETPIAEDETPRPLSLYGMLKYEAEQIVLASVANPLIIRMAGFFGGEERDKNFVGRIIPAIQAAMLQGKTTFDVGTRVWQPTWTDDLATNTLHLISRGASGTYQMACQGQATFAELAHEIVVALGWQDKIAIVPVDASAVSQSELGRRPDIAVLSCSRLSDEHMNLQRSWQSTLHAYLRHPFFDQYRLETVK
jgi:dTDP-4-dehydrorhamnose reductase